MWDRRLVSWHAYELARPHLGRSFPYDLWPRTNRPERRRRVLILSHDISICRSQIFPFFYFAKKLSEQYDVSLSEWNLARFVSSEPSADDLADTVLLQPWFDIGETGLEQLLDTVATRCRPRRVVFLDSYAPTDLRFANVLADRVDVYVKKHVLRDRSMYGKTTVGDTNLTDYFCQRFGIQLPSVTYTVPSRFLDKLVVGPSFLTADYLLAIFGRDVPPIATRQYDVHARLGRKGSDWYSSLRMEALEAIGKVRGNVLSEFGVSKRQYLTELARSRICFSPFGYGEVAWRDYEAVAYGSLLLKQDMDHCETNPNIFVPFETYVPVRWDLSDLKERTEYYLDNPQDSERITMNAFGVASEYVRQERFIIQMEPVFAG